jgi:hypothetical protein
MWAILRRNFGYSDTTFSGSLLALDKAEIVDMPQVYFPFATKARCPFHKFATSNRAVRL